MPQKSCWEAAFIKQCKHVLLRLQDSKSETICIAPFGRPIPLSTFGPVECEVSWPKSVLLICALLSWVSLFSFLWAGQLASPSFSLFLESSQAMLTSMSFAPLCFFTGWKFLKAVRNPFASIVPYISSLENTAIAFRSSNATDFCFAASAKPQTAAKRSSTRLADFAAFTLTGEQLFKDGLEEGVELFSASGTEFVSSCDSSGWTLSSETSGWRSLHSASAVVRWLKVGWLPKIFQGFNSFQVVPQFIFLSLQSSFVFLLQYKAIVVAVIFSSATPVWPSAFVSIKESRNIITSAERSEKYWEMLSSERSA